MNLWETRNAIHLSGNPKSELSLNPSRARLVRQPFGCRISELFRHSYFGARISAAALLLLVAFTTTGWFWQGGPPDEKSAAPEPRLPRIQPDYAGLVIPTNICPLNFQVEEAGTRYFVRVTSPRGQTLEVQSASPKIQFPEKRWKELLQSSAGQELRYDLLVKATNAVWRRFESFTNRVASEGVDGYLVYRKIHPSHNTWSAMGIYQRDLQTFEERPVIQNRKFGNDCCHCHSLRENNPSFASLDIRSPKYGNSLLLISNHVPIKVTGNVSFSAWHPSGRMIVSSFNKPRLLLHTVKNDMRDIVELDGWLGYYSLADLQVKRIPGLDDERQLLTFPTWTPDGKTLYFCSSPNPWVVPGKTRNENYQEIRFDLRRIPYQAESDTWGTPETLLTVAETGLSMVQPRVSPDGRWLTFGMCEYSCWANYHPESDLYIADLYAAQTNGKLSYRKMEMNSAECESWHSWSSNSRWIVFSSKRGNPLFNRPHLAYVDGEGRLQKAFVVPQFDPAFYDSYLKTYTIPTLANAPFEVSESALAATIKSPQGRALIMPPAKPSAARPAAVVNPLDPIGEDATRQQ